MTTIAPITYSDALDFAQRRVQRRRVDHLLPEHQRRERRTGCAPARAALPSAVWHRTAPARASRAARRRTARSWAAAPPSAAPEAPQPGEPPDARELRPERAARASGSARHRRIHGRASTISGGATTSSSTCWTMCDPEELLAEALERRGERDAAPRRARVEVAVPQPAPCARARCGRRAPVAVPVEDVRAPARAPSDDRTGLTTRLPKPGRGSRSRAR